MFFKNTKQPPKNTMIIVMKWRKEKTEDGYDYYQDLEEINSNQYNPSYYDGWMFKIIS